MGLTLTGADGVNIASMERAKAYIDISGLISGRAGSNRVVLEKPVIQYRPGVTDALVPAGKGDGERPATDWSGVLIVRDGSFSYIQDGHASPLNINGVDAELSFGDALWALFSIKSFEYDIPGENWPLIAPSIRGRFKYTDDSLEVDALSAYIGESVFRVGGVIANPGQAGMNGDLDLSLSLEIGSISNAFGLERNPYGNIRSEGTLSIAEALGESLIEMDMEADFYLETLLDALRHSQREHYSGRLEGNGTLKGPLNDLKGRVEAVISESRIQGLSLDKATALLTYEDEKLIISDGKADLYDGEADVNVYFGVLSDAPFGLSVIFRDVVSQPLLERINIGHIGLPDGRLTGEFNSDGLLFSPRGNVRFEGGTRDDTPLGRMNYFSGRFHTEDGDLMLDGFDLRSQRTHVSFDGRMGLYGPSIAFDGYAISTDYSDVLYPLDNGFSAGGRLDISVLGTTSDPRISIEASLWDSSFRGYSIGDTSLSAEYRKDLLVIRKLTASTNEAIHSASGMVRFPDAMSLFDIQAPYFDLRAMADNTDLGGLVSVFVDGVDIDGTADVNVTLRGTADAPSLEGHARVRDVSSYGRVIDSGRLGFFLEGGRLGVTDSLFMRDDSRVSIKGHWSYAGDYGAEIRAEKTWLSYLLPEMRGADFMVNADLSGEGMASEPSFALSADLLDGHFMNVPVQQGRLEAFLENGTATASIDLMNSQLTGKGSVELDNNMPWEIALSLGYGRYDNILRSFVHALPGDMILAVGGDVALNGDRDHFNAKVRLERANATLYGQGFANIGPFEFDVADRHVHIKNVSMRGAHVSFDLWGKSEIGRSIDIGLNADASLLPFARYLPDVSHMRGNTRLSVNISGAWDKPFFDGKAEIFDASIAFKGMPQRITSINSLIILDKGRLLIDNASAKAGGGDIQLSGNLELDGLGVSDINLEATVRTMSARLSSHFNSVLDGFVLLTGNSVSQDINGEISVREASYRQKIDWGELLMGGAETPLGDTAWRDRISLNVRLHGHDNITVDNNLAVSPVGGDVYVRGTLASPVLSGRVEAFGGKAFYRNSELDIIRATADYLDMPLAMPVLSISARTEIKEYDIWVNMQGRADRLDLELASDPPLDDNEILALLTYGDLGSGYDAVQGIGAAEAASLAASGIGLREILDERRAIFSTLDRVQIDPYLTGAGGSVAPRLTVSKKLLEDKLYLTYAVTPEEENEIKLEYLLGDNISVIGGHDYTGSVGGDLKFRFRFE